MRKRPTEDTKNGNYFSPLLSCSLSVRKLMWLRENKTWEVDNIRAHLAGPKELCL